MLFESREFDGLSPVVSFLRWLGHCERLTLPSASVHERFCALPHQDNRRLSPWPWEFGKARNTTRAECGYSYAHFSLVDCFKTKEKTKVCVTDKPHTTTLSRTFHRLSQRTSGRTGMVELSDRISPNFVIRFFSPYIDQEETPKSGRQLTDDFLRKRFSM